MCFYLDLNVETSSGYWLNRNSSTVNKGKVLKFTQGNVAAGKILVL